jgi:hypothetical protein
MDKKKKKKIIIIAAIVIGVLIILKYTDMGKKDDGKATVDVKVEKVEEVKVEEIVEEVKTEVEKVTK